MCYIAYCIYTKLKHRISDNVRYRTCHGKKNLFIHWANETKLSQSWYLNKYKDVINENQGQNSPLTADHLKTGHCYDLDDTLT